MKIKAEDRLVSHKRAYLGLTKALILSPSRLQITTMSYHTNAIHPSSRISATVRPC